MNYLLRRLRSASEAVGVPAVFADHFICNLLVPAIRRYRKLANRICDNDFERISPQDLNASGEELVFGGLFDVVDDDVLGGDLDLLDFETEGAEVPMGEGEGVVHIDCALMLVRAEA
jgi:hypothetical protein